MHILGSTRRAYRAPLAALGVPITGDTSTPAQQARAGDAALAWGYTDRYGLPRDLLRRSRSARLAFWLCRERDRLGLPWAAPGRAWREALPGLTPRVKPQPADLFAAWRRIAISLPACGPRPSCAPSPTRPAWR